MPSTNNLHEHELPRDMPLHTAVAGGAHIWCGPGGGLRPGPGRGLLRGPAPQRPGGLTGAWPLSCRCSRARARARVSSRWAAFEHRSGQHAARQLRWASMHQQQRMLRWGNALRSSCSAREQASICPGHGICQLASYSSCTDWPEPAGSYKARPAAWCSRRLLLCSRPLQSRRNWHAAAERCGPWHCPQAVWLRVL
jgi:hypothetical protein